jgi:hypothetical protein
MNHKKLQKRQRRAQGHSLMELVVAVMLLVPIILLAVDSFLVLSAIQLNDRTCKEAARVASSGDPRLAADRAEEVISWQMPNPGGPYSIRLVQATSSVKRSQIEELFPYGGQVAGVVDVTTEVAVKPFFASWIPGSKDLLCFQSNQEVPITYVVPNVAETSRESKLIFSRSAKEWQ